jgi:hypothetical protein
MAAALIEIQEFHPCLIGLASLRGNYAMLGFLASGISSHPSEWKPLQVTGDGHRGLSLSGKGRSAFGSQLRVSAAHGADAMVITSLPRDIYRFLAFLAFGEIELDEK